MWASHSKKTKAAMKWHHSAMLVDPRKTKIIIINTENPKTDDIAGSAGTMDDCKVANVETGARKIKDCFARNIETLYEIFGTPVSFMLID